MSFLQDPAVRSAVSTGVVGIVLLLLNQRANRRSEATTNALRARQLDSEGKAVDLSVLQASITDLTGRLGRVETDLAHEQEQRRLSNAYARTLAEVLRDNRMPVPLAPPGLDLD